MRSVWMIGLMAVRIELVNGSSVLLRECSNIFLDGLGTECLLRTSSKLCSSVNNYFLDLLVLKSTDKTIA